MLAERCGVVTEQQAFSFSLAVAFHCDRSQLRWHQRTPIEVYMLVLHCQCHIFGLTPSLAEPGGAVAGPQAFLRLGSLSHFVNMLLLPSAAIIHIFVAINIYLQRCVYIIIGLTPPLPFSLTESSSMVTVPQTFSFSVFVTSLVYRCCCLPPRVYSLLLARRTICTYVQLYRCTLVLVLRDRSYICRRVSRTRVIG